MTIRNLLLIAMTLALVPNPLAPSEVAVAESGPPVRLTLDSLFSRGAVLEDLTGDGTVNFVNVRIVVPVAPSNDR
jgi:hypothetical protein